MYALQPIHELQCDDDDCLNLELALLERFFEFFEVDAEQLHHQVVVVLVRAIRKKTGEADPTVF